MLPTARAPVLASEAWRNSIDRYNEGERKMVADDTGMLGGEEENIRRA